MIQLKISSGELAGVIHDVRHFPFHIGRSSHSDLRFEEPGIWDEHLKLELVPAEGIVLSTCGQAITSVNGCPVQSVLLHNGDRVEIGSLKMRFWLGETRQARLSGLEWFIWMMLGMVTAAEIGLLIWLAR